jgi:hypothetical protein
MTHMSGDTWLFVLSLIWLVVLLVAIPFVLGNLVTPSGPSGRPDHPDTQCD